MRLDEAGLVRWGNRIGHTLRPPAFLTLAGPLGAGKSVLARAIGEGAGVQEPMPSPSYNLLFRYRTRGGHEIVHLDLFRIEAQEELWELGWEQIGAEAEIVIVEWPDRAEGHLPPNHWRIELSIPDDAADSRDVGVIRVGRPPDLPPFPMSLSVSGTRG